MLYHITEEIITAIENKNKKAIEVLERVIIAIRDGKHFIFIERQYLDKLIIQDCYNDNRTSLILRKIRNKYSTYSSIKNIISLTVKFTIGGNAYITENLNNGNREILIPIEEIDDFDLFTTTQLLGENITELSFYNSICSYHKYLIQQNINTVFYPLNGGGNTLHSVVKTIMIYKNKFCLAFVDSDKKHPEGEYGDTLKQVMAIENKAFNCHYIYSKKFREIENLIPLNLLSEVCRENIDWNKGYVFLEDIVKNGGCVNFYDVKKGMSLKTFKEIKDPIYLNYIIQQLVQATANKKEKFEMMHSIEVMEDDKSEIILPSLGDKVLDKAVDFINKNTNWMDELNLTPELEEEWRRIGQEILNWTCASYPIRA